jgi:hypothetical protein
LALFQVGMIHAYSQNHDSLKALPNLRALPPNVSVCLERIILPLRGCCTRLESSMSSGRAGKPWLTFRSHCHSSFNGQSFGILWMSLYRVQALLGQRREDARSSFNEAEALIRTLPHTLLPIPSRIVCPLCVQ